MDLYRGLCYNKNIKRAIKKMARYNTILKHDGKIATVQICCALTWNVYVQYRVCSAARKIIAAIYENERDRKSPVAARAGRYDDTCHTHVTEEIYPMWHLENVVT